MKVSETKREENTSKGKGHGMGACYRQAQCLWLSEGPGQGVQTDAKLRQAPVEDESSRTDLFSCNGRAGEVMRCSTFRKIIKFELWWAFTSSAAGVRAEGYKMQNSKAFSTDEDLEGSQWNHTRATLAGLEKKGGWMTAAAERWSDMEQVQLPCQPSWSTTSDDIHGCGIISNNSPWKANVLCVVWLINERETQTSFL